MLKFNVGDLGMHVTLTLLGFGVGLIVGAYVQSAVEKKRFAALVEDVFLDDEDVVILEVEEEEEEEVKREKKLDERYEKLAREYEVTNVQRQMYSNGVITFDQLERSVMGKKKTPVVSYNEPSLEELYEDSLARYISTDGRFELKLMKPNAGYRRTKTVVVDIMTYDVYLSKRSGLIPYSDWPVEEDIMDILHNVLSDVDVVYILDNETSVLYEAHSGEPGEDLYDFDDEEEPSKGVGYDEE